MWWMELVVVVVARRWKLMMLGCRVVVVVRLMGIVPVVVLGVPVWWCLPLVWWKKRKGVVDGVAGGRWCSSRGLWTWWWLVVGVVVGGARHRDRGCRRWLWWGSEVCQVEVVVRINRRCRWC